MSMARIVPAANSTMERKQTSENCFDFPVTESAVHLHERFVYAVLLLVSSDCSYLITEAVLRSDEFHEVICYPFGGQIHEHGDGNNERHRCYDRADQA